MKTASVVMKQRRLARQRVDKPAVVEENQGMTDRPQLKQQLHDIREHIALLKRKIADSEDLAEREGWEQELQEATSTKAEVKSLLGTSE